MQPRRFLEGLKDSSRVKWSKVRRWRGGGVLTGTGSIEGQHWRGWGYSPLAGHLAGSQTDNTAALFVHEAQSTAVPVRLGPVVLVRPASSRCQLGSDHELGSLGVEPPTVAGVSCERESKGFFNHPKGGERRTSRIIVERRYRPSRSLTLECHYPLNKL